jgi:hypothetical protein
MRGPRTDEHVLITCTYSQGFTLAGVFGLTAQSPGASVAPRSCPIKLPGIK